MVDVKNYTLTLPLKRMVNDPTPVLGIDGNVLLQKLWHADTPEPEKMLDLIKEIQACCGASDENTTVIFDHGRSAKRTALMAGYKGNRAPKTTDQLLFFAQAKNLVKGLYNTLQADNTEGDDQAAFMARTVPDLNHILFLWTIDHDWLQLACDLEGRRVIVIRQDFKTKENRFYTEAWASEFLDFPARRWAELAAFTGDPGDNVPAFFTDTQARALLKKYGSFKNALALSPLCRGKMVDLIKNYLATSLVMTAEEEEKWLALIGFPTSGAGSKSAC